MRTDLRPADWQRALMLGMTAPHEWGAVYFHANLCNETSMKVKVQ